MRKISIILFCALCIVACGGRDTYRVEKPNLSTRTDSLNYMAGYFVGLGVKNTVLLNDSSDLSVAEYVDALEAGYAGSIDTTETYELPEGVIKGAQHIGTTIREQERESGLMGIEGLETDFDLIKQGLINGLYIDTVFIHPDSAIQYLNTVLTPMALRQLSES